MRRLTRPLLPVLLLTCLLSPAMAGAETQTLSFQSGFNFLGLTVTPDAPLTTESFFADQAVQSVFLFDPASQAFQYQLRIASGLFGTSRTVTPGAGFIVRTDGASSRDVTGVAYAPAGLALGANFSFIGAPSNAAAVGAKALLGAYGDLQSVFRWDAGAQAFGFVLRTPTILFGTDFTLVPGQAYFVKATQGGTVSLDPNQFPAKTLSSIALSATSHAMEAGATYDFVAVTATATYSDQSTATVVPTWSVPEAQGVIAGTVFTPAGGVTSATLTASYTEGAVTRTATIAVTIAAPQGPNPALRDLTFQTYASCALLAVNTSGVESGAAENVGELPATVAASAPRFAPAIPVKSMIKDRPQPAVSGGPSRAPAPSRAISAGEAIGSTHTFVLTGDDRGTSMPATKVYGDANSKCLIYVETAEMDNVQAKPVDWSVIGTQFSQTNGIYDKMVAAYGAPSDLDNNGQVVILYYAMTSTWTLGYFYSVDLFPDQGNDQMEIFYMNLTWGGEGVTDPAGGDMVRTLAHEFQHLINFARRRLLASPSLPDMDTWMNEGLSESAEQLVGGTVGEGRIQTFKNDSNSLIRNGQALCKWPESGNDEAYALVYTFFQYLKNQSTDRDAIFKRFIEHADGDYRAVEAIMKGQNPAFANATMADLLVLYRVANVVNGDGIHGYGTEKASFDFKTANGIAAPANLSGLALEPGGAIHVYPSPDDLTAFGSGVKRGNVEFVRINP